MTLIDRLYVWFYALEIPRVLGISVCACLLWALFQNDLKSRKETLGRRLSGGLLIAALTVTVWAVLCRSTTVRTLYLQPFHTFEMAQRNPEAYRSALMNAILFAPIGLTLPQVLPRRWSFGKRLGWTVLFGLAFSILLESLQFILKCGTTETDDVICNTLGALIGALNLPLAERLKKYLREEE